MTIETLQSTKAGADFDEVPHFQVPEERPITEADINDWLDKCDKSLHRLMSGISNEALKAADIRRPN